MLCYVKYKSYTFNCVCDHILVYFSDCAAFSEFIFFLSYVLLDYFNFTFLTNCEIIQSVLTCILLYIIKVLSFSSSRFMQLSLSITSSPFYISCHSLLFLLKYTIIILFYTVMFVWISSHLIIYLLNIVFHPKVYSLEIYLESSHISLKVSIFQHHLLNFTCMGL